MKFDARTVLSSYNTRFQSMMKMKEIFPVIVRVAEEFELPQPSALGVGHIEWNFGDSTTPEHKTRALINVSPWSGDISFSVKNRAGCAFYRHNMSDPQYVHVEAREFFRIVSERYKAYEAQKKAHEELWKES